MMTLWKSGHCGNIPNMVLVAKLGIIPVIYSGDQSVHCHWKASELSRKGSQRLKFGYWDIISKHLLDIMGISFSTHSFDGFPFLKNIKKKLALKLQSQVHLCCTIDKILIISSTLSVIYYPCLTILLIHV